uniref:Uncharacterized protein n=1 Tax=Glossina palpalis gambiensis TaxID=67801 RepID=A0A1B0BMG9_9MUSC
MYYVVGGARLFSFHIIKARTIKMPKFRVVLAHRFSAYLMSSVLVNFSSSSDVNVTSEDSDDVISFLSLISSSGSCSTADSFCNSVTAGNSPDSKTTVFLPLMNETNLLFLAAGISSGPSDWIVARVVAERVASPVNGIAAAAVRITNCNCGTDVPTILFCLMRMYASARSGATKAAGLKSVFKKLAFYGKTSIEYSFILLLTSLFVCACIYSTALLSRFRSTSYCKILTIY